MNKTGWINKSLIWGSFLVLLVSSYSFLQAIYRDSQAVQFAAPKNTSLTPKQTPGSDQLPSTQETVTILANRDFGPSSRETSPAKQRTAEDDCSVDDYIQSVLHLHRNQGVHVRFQNGQTGYLLKNKYYEIGALMTRKKNAREGERKINKQIAYTGADNKQVLFNLRLQTGNETSECQSRITIADSTN